jgi:Tol biopolymer transport system component
MDETGLRQLTPFGLAAAHEFTSAQWSPDGTKIISETHQGRLFVANVDGTCIRPIPLQIGSGQYFASSRTGHPTETNVVLHVNQWRGGHLHG